MPQITVLPHDDICPHGAILNVEVGANICQSLLNNDINIEHACDMSCACTTCHIIIRNGFDTLNDIQDNEEDLLDMAWGLTPYSRLSCQSIISEQDITIEIPKYSINQVKESL